MEIILGIALIAVVAWYFTKKKDVTEADGAEAPYKVEAPQPVIPTVTETVEIKEVFTAPDKKPRAKKSTDAKKVTKTTEKATKKPRAKKTTK